MPMRLKHAVLLSAALLMQTLTVRAEPQRLRLSLQLPITSHIGVNLSDFKERVERATAKAIEVEIIDKARAYDDQAVADAVAKGAIEMGVINIGNLARSAPVVDFLQQPFLLNFDAIVRAATDPARPFRTIMDKAVLEATGIRILWWQPYGSTIVLSKGRDAATPQAVQGRKFRAASETQANFVNQCGATAVVISATKQYEAVKNGDVDYVMTGITGLISRKLWEVTDTITRTEHAPFEFVVTINERVWQGLTPATRDVMMKAAREVEMELRHQIQAIEDEAYAFAKSKGMTIRTLSANDVAEWRACSASVTESFMTQAGPAAYQLMMHYGRLRTDPCCSGPADASFTLR